MESLLGTWRLASIRFEDADTEERVDMYGADPLGFLILTETGRMMVVVTARDRALPKIEADTAELFGSMMAYTGEYRIEDGDRFITAVDVAWHPAWNRTEQTRYFEIQGDILSLSTSIQTHPLFPGRTGRGIITWCGS
jgi:hypothetical protein